MLFHAWIEINIDLLHGLRWSGSKFPSLDSGNRTLSKDRITPQDANVAHLPIRKHRGLQTNQASDLSVLQRLGI